MLYTLSSSPFASQALTDILRLATAQDALLLWSDGVLAALAGSSLRNLWPPVRSKSMFCRLMRRRAVSQNDCCRRYKLLIIQVGLRSPSNIHNNWRTELPSALVIKSAFAVP